MGYFGIIFALLYQALKVFVVAAFRADVGAIRAGWGRDFGDRDAGEGEGEGKETDEVHVWIGETVA